VIVVLTGTDINHPEIGDETSGTRRTMAVADRLVVLHEASLSAVPESLREKCQVIYPSVNLPGGLTHRVTEKVGETEEFEVIMAGNVRAEKNLPVVVDACAELS